MSLDEPFTMGKISVPLTPSFTSLNGLRMSVVPTRTAGLGRVIVDTYVSLGVHTSKSPLSGSGCAESTPETSVYRDPRLSLGGWWSTLEPVP